MSYSHVRLSNYRDDYAHVSRGDNNLSNITYDEKR